MQGFNWWTLRDNVRTFIKEINTLNIIELRKIYNKLAA